MTTKELVNSLRLLIDVHSNLLETHPLEKIEEGKFIILNSETNETFIVSVEGEKK